jgi:hypothetical protein
MDIVEPNDIEAEADAQQTKAEQKKPISKNPARQYNQEVPQQTTSPNNKLNKPDAPVTQEKIKEILDTAYERLSRADKEFTIENADWTIRRLCDNNKLYKACIATLESKPATEVGVNE